MHTYASEQCGKDKAAVGKGIDWQNDMQVKLLGVYDAIIKDTGKWHAFLW